MEHSELNIVEVGRLGKPYGYSGAIHVYLDENVELLDNPSHLFVSIEGLPVPFRVVEHGSHNGTMTVVLADVDSKEGIEQYKNAKVSVESEYVSFESSLSNELIGYTVFDQDSSLVGSIDSIVEQDPLLFLSVILAKAKREVLLPYHENLIISSDDSKRTLTLEIAEGLLDL